MASEREPATRLADLEADSDLPDDLDDTRVCYWRSPGGWWIYLPRAGIGQLVNHDVTEHEDGTITVKPSIGLRKEPGSFARHGFLERGLWREV